MESSTYIFLMWFSFIWIFIYIWLFIPSHLIAFDGSLVIRVFSLIALIFLCFCFLFITREICGTLTTHLITTKNPTVDGNGLEMYQSLWDHRPRVCCLFLRWPGIFFRIKSWNRKFQEYLGPVSLETSLLFGRILAGLVVRKT